MRRGAVLISHLATFAIVLGLGYVHATRIGGYEFTGTYRFSWLLGYAALLSVSAYAAGIPDVPRTARGAAVAGLSAAVSAALGISLVQLAFGSLLLPRYVVFAAAAIVVPVYTLASGLSRGGWRREEERDRLLVVAGEHELEALRRDLSMAPERPSVISAAVKPGESLIDAATAARANVVVLDRVAASDPRIVDQAALLHERGLRVRTLTLFYEEWLGKLPMSELERVSMMFDIGELHRTRYARLRRILDVSVAIAAAVPLICLLPVVYLANVLGNRGPLFHRQYRVGRGGTTFVIYKLRTMKPGSDPQTWAGQDDARITPVGKFLRRTHLDELPQMVNMLRGDLSLVGPRPEQVEYVERLREKIPFYDLRHLVRPGLTGWAQVKYGYSGDEVGAFEKLQYDFYYLRHQGFALDMKTIGRTLRSVARQ